jgi:hypothetical protein
MSCGKRCQEQARGRPATARLRPALGGLRHGKQLTADATANTAVELMHHKRLMMDGRRQENFGVTFDGEFPQLRQRCRSRVSWRSRMACSTVSPQ